MNVTAGDLAYIVWAEGKSASCIGRVVEVVAFYGTVNTVRHGDVPVWDCRCKSELIAAEGKIFLPGDMVPIPDEILRRIAGPSIDITETTEKPVEEVA